MKNLVLSIQGMSCGHCLNTVNQALRALPGVEVQSVRIGGAELSIDEKQTDFANVAAAITKAGYVVSGAIE